MVPGPPLDEVAVQVHIRPVGLDVLDDLVDSGDLDPVFRRAHTFTLSGSRTVWRRQDGNRCARPRQTP